MINIKENIPTITKRQECQVFSRVNGWFTSVYQTWNKGKRAEWEDRKPYNVKDY